MRYKIFSTIIFFTISCSMAWALDKPLIDYQYKKVQEEISQLTGECRQKEKKAYSKFNCRNNVEKRFRKEGKIRGTKEFCEINYSKLNKGQLEGFLSKLKKEQNTARHSQDLLFDGDRQLGEVTKEDLQTEMIWIESRLARMQKKKIKNLEKSMD